MDDRLKPAAIYIQGLPTSIGNIQVEDICKKAGKIKKIKVYRDAGGVPKGDALVVFEAKRDRDVAADAVAMLDDMDVDQGGLGCYTISVSEAQFSQPRRAPKPKEEAPRSQRELAAAAAKAWGKELPPTDVVQAGDYSAPADCPKALISNVFDSTKTTERDASIETEFGRECQRFGRVLDAECLVRGPDAGALLISFTAVDAARKCCVAMHGRTFDGRGLRCELWPTGARPARRDPSPSPSVSSRRVDPSPSPAREVEVVSAPPRPSSEGRSGAAFSVQELAYIDRVAKAAPPRPPAQAQERARRAGVGPPAEAPPRQRRGFSATPPVSAASTGRNSAAPAGRGRGVDNRPAWMTSGGAAPAPVAPPAAPPSGRGRGVDNRPAWMTRPDRPGAPPPRTGEPPKAYVEPPASAPTRRVREAAPAPARGGPMSIQGFIKATGHAAPGDAGGAPEPKRAKRNGRRGAADFFD